jgi:hypothetical protein
MAKRKRTQLKRKKRKAAKKQGTLTVNFAPIDPAQAQLVRVVIKGRTKRYIPNANQWMRMDGSNQAILLSVPYGNYTAFVVPHPTTGGHKKRLNRTKVDASNSASIYVTLP